jgi:hypothetical protein
LDELKANIREAIHDVLQRTMDDFTKRLQECITAEGVNLLHSVFKSDPVLLA